MLELYRWQNDSATVQQLWPVVKKAAEWQMNVSAADGAPEHLCNTYDILGPTKHLHIRCAYNCSVTVLLEILNLSIWIPYYFEVGSICLYGLTGNALM